MATLIFAYCLLAGLWGFCGLVSREPEPRWRRRLQATACLFGLLVAGFCGGREVARKSTVNRQPLAVNHRLLTAGHSRFAVYRQQSAVDSSPFIGSTIKDVYHRAGCRYAEMMEHSRTYATHDEALADGKVPCKVCLPVIE